MFPRTNQSGESPSDGRSDVVTRLFHESPHAHLALDADGRILRANVAFASMLGVAPSTLAGRPLASIALASEREAEDLRHALDEVRAGRAALPFEQRYARPGGSVAHCRLSIGPVRGADGAFDHALVAIEDISTNVTAATTLQESEERFRTLVELLPDAVFFFVRGLVAHANPAAVRLLGARNLGELLEKKSTELIHPDSIPDVAARAVTLTNGESVPALEEKWVRLDGAVVDVESNVARMPLAAGKAFVVILRDIRDRKENEERARKEREERAASHEAREREQWLRQIIDLLPTCVYARNESGELVLANHAFAKMIGAGVEPRDVVGRTLEELGVPPDVAESMREHDRRVLGSGVASLVSDEVFVDRAGRRRLFETNRLAFALRERPAVLCASADVTEKRRLEAELLQSQKLDAIGRLAGGIAHDFNNLLTVLVTSADELAMRSGAPDPDIERIHEVASKATALTQQLLAFARKSSVEARVVAVNELVQDVVRLLARVLAENIAVETALDPDAKDVLVDRSKMERVLVNLAVNARDAMARGGTLTIATRNAPAPEGFAGEWVAVSVSDTGTGMSPETRAHVFEPFFTTKAVGEGTGLGLATCFGIVQQLGGRIDVESELGQGTTFRVLLPATEGRNRSSMRPAKLVGGSETVLLLDDDPHVLSATARVLKQLGYRVLVASSPDEGIEIARTFAEPIDLLLSDVLMPGKTGPETAREIRAMRPDVRVLFMSGYSGDALTVSGEGILPKPYSRQEMAAKLREVFEAPVSKL